MPLQAAVALQAVVVLQAVEVQLFEEVRQAVARQAVVHQAVEVHLSHAPCHVWIWSPCFRKFH